MKLAKSNTEKNLETCGVLAGSLVSSDSLKITAVMLSVTLIVSHCHSAEK